MLAQFAEKQVKIVAVSCFGATSTGGDLADTYFNQPWLVHLHGATYSAYVIGQGRNSAANHEQTDSIAHHPHLDGHINLTSCSPSRHRRLLFPMWLVRRSCLDYATSGQMVQWVIFHVADLAVTEAGMSLGI